MRSSVNYSQRLHRRHVVCHYALIYLCLLFSQSTAFMAYLNSLYVGIAVVAIGLIAMLVKDTKHATYWFMFVGAYLVVIVFDRFVVGGTGLSPWATLSSFAMVGYWAVAFDPERFVDRFVKTVVFIACVSVAMFSIQQVSPITISALLPISYDTGWSTGIWSNTYDQVIRTSTPVKGMLLYTYRPFEPTRNVGIFSEPANYQIVLNMALWFVLFMRDRLGVDDRCVRFYAAALVVTILTSGSTSGYLVLSIQVLLFIFWGVSSPVAGVKRALLSIGVVAIIILLVDWILNDAGSVIQTVLLNKLVGSGSGFDLSEDTGSSRVGTIALSLQTMANNPLGIGHETFELIKSADEEAGGGGGWFAMGASEGIFAFIMVPLWVYLPIVKSSMSSIQKISLLFVCIYCSIAQSYTFMPLYVSAAVLCQFCFGRDVGRTSVDSLRRVMTGGSGTISSNNQLSQG